MIQSCADACREGLLMSPPGTPALGTLLLQRLAEIPCLAQARCCAVLNHPSHGNIGDHLIWLAQIHYLEQIRQIPVRYVAAPGGYQRRALHRAVGDQPILLSGGGYLGDIWPRLLEFVEMVVAGHQGNPMIILSQSLHFRSRACLERASAILQGHPALTLVLRDERSYELARHHFGGCRLLLAPDMAFALPIDSLTVTALANGRSHRPWLALRRRDRERASGWDRCLDSWGTAIETSDWLPLAKTWIWGDPRWPLSVPLAMVLRETFQRRLLMPREALARRRWLRRLAPEWQRAASASPLTRLSLGMVHDACRQLAGRELVISDRLHAVILASLLGLPSLAVDNQMGKIHAFVKTWSPWLPLARAIAPEQLPLRLEQAASAHFGGNF